MTSLAVPLLERPTRMSASGPLHPTLVSAEPMVLVTDEDAMARCWIRGNLSGSGLSVAGEATSLDQAGALLSRRRVDIILLGFRPGERTAIEFLSELRRGGIDVPALVLTAVPVPGLNERVFEAGGQGCLVKSADAGELLMNISRVIAGQIVADPRNPPSPAARLTPRERDVLRYVARGITNHDIGARLGVSVNTVKTLQARAAGKLGTSRRTETVIVAREMGLL